MSARKVEHAKKYPMCTRLAREHSKILELQRFLDWCEEENEPRIVLGESSDSEELVGVYGRQRELLIYKYFEIDSNELEKERRAMLEEQRKLNAEGDEC